MTIDVSIEEGQNWDHRSRLRTERLWRVIGDLSDLEISQFVTDAMRSVDIEDDYDVEFSLGNYLSDWAGNVLDPYRSPTQSLAVDLEEIEAKGGDDMLQMRKLAFMRIWNSFDLSTKASFVERVSSKLSSAGDPE